LTSDVKSDSSCESSRLLSSSTSTRVGTSSFGYSKCDEKISSK